MTNEHAHDESGNLIGVVQFDAEAIERNLGELRDEMEGLNPEEIEANLKMLKLFLGWAWQNGECRSNGLGVRLAVLCWVFLDDVKTMNQTELAKVIGKKDRQSLNRWVIVFRKYFNFSFYKGHKNDAARKRYSEERKA